LVNWTQAMQKIIYPCIFVVLYQSVRRTHQFHASLSMQKAYRGFATRKHFHHFREICFDYVNSDVECMLSGDINNLLNFGFQNKNNTPWEPSKPMIRAKDNDCNDHLNDKEALVLQN